MNPTPRLIRTLPGTIRFYSIPPPASQAHPYLSRSNVNPSSSTSSTTSPHVGPFPLPHSQLDRDYRISQQAKTWSKLNPTEKVGQVARQTSSFFVVLAGAGLCGLVFWAVGSELFSENSPTRIFEDIAERLEKDQGLNSILIGPLSFHGSQTSDRLRRNRRISHSLTHDPQTNLETLFIRFTVQGKDLTLAAEEREQDWLDWCKRWVGPLVWQDSHHPERYNPTLSTDSSHEKELLEEKRREEEEEKKRKSWRGWVGGVLGNAFGGVSRGVASANKDGSDAGGGFFKRLTKPRLGEYAYGEVVAELQKDPRTNQFVYKQLFVAFPNTSSPSYYRHDIPTDVVVPAEEGSGKGLDRLRVWQRSKTVVQ